MRSFLATQRLASGIHGVQRCTTGWWCNNHLEKSWSSSVGVGMTSHMEVIKAMFETTNQTKSATKKNDEVLPGSQKCQIHRNIHEKSKNLYQGQQQTAVRSMSTREASNNQTMFRQPRLMAKCKAVSPASVLAFASAPDLSNKRTTSTS